MNPLLFKLADYVLNHTDWIVERWLHAVRGQSDLRSPDRLSRPQLIDHLPALLRDLAERLRSAGTPEPRQETKHAQTHGTYRWHQGYDIEEVMRESGLVRQVVALDCLREFQRDEPAFDNTARDHAETIIHQFFTDMAVESARQFAGEKEKALRAAEQNSSAMLESSLDGIIVMDAAGRVREWNPAAELLFGYQRTEAVGAELASLIIPPELREQHRRGLDHYVRTGAGPLLGQRIEVPAVRADGLRILVELAITPYRIEEETLFTGSIRDITARQAAETASQRLAAIVEYSSDSITSVDLDGNITSWNNGAERLFGYSATEAIGQPMSILVPEERWQEELDAMARIRRGESIDAHETLRRRKDGSIITVSVTFSPIVDKSGAVVGASRISRDISDRKRAEAELREQKEAAEAANQAKDRFLAALSHELRTPLNPVLMWACATIESQTLDPALRDGLKMICRNVEMEARLIDDLLDLTRVARGKLKLDLQRCSADALLQHALEIVRSQLAVKNLHVSVALGATNHQLIADPTRIEQVFWNLLSNAQKFTPEGGAIAVRSYDAAAGVVAFEISDSGTGIDAEVMAKLFHPFEQARTSSQGLGLGLAICHSIVELHGGKISAANRSGDSGAIFTVELHTVEPARLTEASGTAADSTLPRLLRILIVEDHEHTASVMKRLLERDGHEVLVAATVREAMELVHAFPIDLLVSDLGLPDGNGFQVMRELTRISEAKGIAVSGYGMEADIERSSRAGFSAHLTKPINVTKLKEVIRQVTTTA